MGIPSEINQVIKIVFTEAEPKLVRAKIIAKLDIKVCIFCYCHCNSVVALSFCIRRVLWSSPARGLLHFFHDFGLFGGNRGSSLVEKRPFFSSV